MRPVQLADIEAAALVLLASAPDARSALAARICTEANIADCYRKRLKRAHPLFGTGTLMSAARRHGRVVRAPACSQTYLECIRLLADCLLKSLSHHSA